MACASLLASLAALVVVVGMVVGGYVYINRVAVGIGRVPVMFATGARGQPAGSGRGPVAVRPPEIALRRYPSTDPDRAPLSPSGRWLPVTTPSRRHRQPTLPPH